MTSFYLITDTHFLSKKQYVRADPFLMRIREDMIAINHTPEILDAYVDFILSDSQTDTVLFLGDNVDNGDLTSHAEFRERLERLEKGGKRVYMTYATHDYIGAEDDECNFQKPRRFTQTGTEPVPFMRRAKLPEYYFDYTKKNSVSYHQPSGSYCVKLCDNVLLIMLIDNGNGRSFCGLYDDGLDWLRDEITKAQKRGEYVITAVHHPVLPPWKIYQKAAPKEMYGGHEKLSKLLLETGVKVIFTGHTHVQSIKKQQDSEGNYFYDISTIALANTFGKMRRVTIDDDGLCTVGSVSVDIEKPLGVSREALYRQNFPGIWERLLPLAINNYDEFVNQARGYLDEELLKKYKPVIKPVLERLNKMRLITAVRLSGGGRTMCEAEKQRLKDAYFKDAVFEVLRHLFTGNAPYSPDTAEYKTVMAAIGKLKKLNIKKLNSLLSGLSLEEAAEEFLYNNRTGDDNAISFYLK